MASITAKFKLVVYQIHDLMFFELPTEYTADTIMEVCHKLGAGMDFLAVDWNNQTLEEALQRMKMFLDGAKSALATQDVDNVGEVANYIMQTLTRFNDISQQNVIDWNNMKIKPPHKVWKKGRARG
tara:strand:- start:580 stop:957 length:378 start_codon:yes stop_codon:yes gene_type:complete